MNSPSNQSSDLWNDVVDALEDSAVGLSASELRDQELTLRRTIDAHKFVSNELRLDCDYIFLQLAREVTENK